MLRKNPFIRGTLLLTAAGVLTRIIGFFYRIFLSRTIGEEGMGIYQLTAPVMALSFSLTCSGIQTAISKYVASYHAKNQTKKSLYSLFAGFILSISLSIVATVFLLQNNEWISEKFLLEKRCAGLVRIFALSIPFASLHACINGYYYGLKKTFLPSITQLIEQLVRVGTVLLLYQISVKNNQSISFTSAMLGILTGEIASCLISVFAITSNFKRTSCDRFPPLCYYSEIIQMAIPLSANRLVLNTLQSIEAVQIPNRLMSSGMTNKNALQSYGVLTGMALPMILFPNALTSSVSVLLLPYISEAQAQQNPQKIRSAVMKCTLSCILMGSICCIFFLLFGDFIGESFFGSQLAGKYIRLLSIICPFLYLDNVLVSILHGLGKAFTAFILNTFSLIIRLLFVILLIPVLGMSGYLIGIFVSQLLLTLLIFFVLRTCNFSRAAL